MAFASMVIATIVLIILGIGFINLIAGIVLGVSWGKKKKSGKKIKLTQKVFTVLCLISGFLFFVVPVAFFLIGSAIKSVEKRIELNEFNSKVYIESSGDFTDGFEVDGVKYVPSDFLYPASEEGQKFCAFVYSDGDFESCYVYTGESGYDILYVEHYSGTYVKEDEYDDIYEYYLEEAPLIVTVHIYGDDDAQFEMRDFDRDTLLELKSYYDSGIDFDCDVSDIDFSFYLVGRSADGAYSTSVSFDVVDGQIVLSHVTGSGRMRGHVIDEENSEYLISIIEDYVDYDF